MNLNYVSTSKFFLPKLLALFFLAVIIQVLVWQNNQEQADASLSGITLGYKNDAESLIRGDFETFLFGPNPPSNTIVLAHPPGYSILMAVVSVFSSDHSNFRYFQIILNAFGILIVWFLVERLFGSRVAWVASVLIALSPQIAYNSILILPDSLAVLPLLGAVYLAILLLESKKVAFAFVCGLLIGISCWLRANALFLPVFFAAAFCMMLPRKRFVGVSFAVVLGFVIIIFPITIRNYWGFNALIPVSLGSGTNLMAGIGDFDDTNIYRIPRSDTEMAENESRRFNRPDYAESLYAPDGLEREKIRVSDSVSIISDNPIWFSWVVLRRGLSFFRLERVPVISPNWKRDEKTPDMIYWLNIPLRFIQKAFITAICLPLFVSGVIFLFRDKEERTKLAILMIVPLYYVCIQSIVHTEYRYILAIQHFMLIISAVASVRAASMFRNWIN